MLKYLYLPLLLITLSVYSQEGDFYMNHYSPSGGSGDLIIYDIKTDNYGLLWMATSNGLIRYDGNSWDFYETPSAALSLLIDEQNRVFAGCVSEVGKMTYLKSAFRYQTIYENKDTSDFYFEAKKSGEFKYFIGNNSLVILDEENNSKVLNADYFSLLSKDDQVVAYTKDSVYSFNQENGTPERTVSKGFRYLKSFGNTSKTILLREDGVIESLDSKALPHSEKLLENEFFVNDGAFINDSLFVVTSIDKGAVFLNLNDTSYFKVINYYSGLPDNEILSVHIDREGGVWFSHQFGLTRIMPLFPTRSFSNFKGLSGQMSHSIFHMDKLWVSTSLGVYYLEQDTTYRTKVYYDVVPLKPVQTAPPPPKPSTEEKGLIGGLFGKKKNANEPNLFRKITSKVNEFMDDQVDKITGKNSDVRYVRREEKTPINITVEYAKVEGTDGKIDQLIEFEGLLLASGTSGIFEINDKSSALVVDEPMKEILPVSKSKLMVYSYSGDLILFEKEKKIWYELWRIPVNDEVLSMYYDSSDKLWVAGPENLYQMSLNDTSLVVQNKYEISNQFFDDLNFIEFEGNISFINSEGFFTIDQQTGEIVEPEKVSQIIKNIDDHLIDNLGNVWAYDGRVWYRISSDGKVQPFEYLSLFPQIQNLYYDSNTDKYWLITADNQLLSYDLDKEIALGNQYNLVVKNLKSQNRVFQTDGKFSLDYDDNSLVVELSKPDYTGLLQTQYQYRLDGLNAEWSDWTGSTVIDFTYLPPGAYQLLVRAKDSFGRQDEKEVIAFNVKTPYWQSPWFYALQIIVFLSLVIVSSRLNQSSSANRFLSGALTIFTIVLFIEFLQSVISSYFSFGSGPVISFLLDAVVALFIFPLEKFLREMITQGGPKIKFKKLAESLNKKS